MGLWHAEAPDDPLVLTLGPGGPPGGGRPLRRSDHSERLWPARAGFPVCTGDARRELDLAFAGDRTLVEHGHRSALVLVLDGDGTQILWFVHLAPDTYSAAHAPSCSSPTRSWRRSGGAWAVLPPGCRRTRGIGSSPTPGPATCASCATHRAGRHALRGWARGRREPAPGAGGRGPPPRPAASAAGADIPPEGVNLEAIEREWVQRAMGPDREQQVRGGAAPGVRPRPALLAAEAARPHPGPAVAARGDRRAGAALAPAHAVATFWLPRKKFPGSYAALTATSCS
jgi:hypothetical protein